MTTNNDNDIWQTQAPDNKAKTLLSTTEISRLTGVTKKSLYHYNEDKIFKPAINNDISGQWAYSLEQVYQLQLIKSIKDMGVKLKNLEGFVTNNGQQNIDAIYDQAYLNMTDRIRTDRRILKNIVHCRQTLQFNREVGARDDLYLRYLPGRCMALLPISYNQNQALGILKTMEQQRYLNAAADKYGWARTNLTGAISSLKLSDKQGLEYLFVELSSPAMPENTGQKIIDGGCYKDVGYIEEICFDCTTGDCALCSRTGAKSPQTVPEIWKGHAQGSQLLDFSLLTKAIREPYITGYWADYSQRIIGKHGDGADTLAKETAANRYVPAMRPMLMPLPVFLPNGVAVCVVPAGFYLCKQHAIDDNRAAYRQMLDKIKELPRKQLTPEIEQQKRDDYLSTHTFPVLSRTKVIKDSIDTKHKGPFTEPFARPMFDGDPEYFSWFEPLNEDNQKQVSLLTNTGLIQESDFCMTDANIQFPTQDYTPRMELQVFVDYPPPPR